MQLMGDVFLVLKNQVSSRSEFLRTKHETFAHDARGVLAEMCRCGPSRWLAHVLSSAFLHVLFPSTSFFVDGGLHRSRSCAQMLLGASPRSMLVPRQPVSGKLLQKSHELLRLLSLGGTPASDGQPRDDSFERHEESQVDPHSLSAQPSGDASDVEHSTVEITASADGRDVPAGAVRLGLGFNCDPFDSSLFPCPVLCLSPPSVLEPRLSVRCLILFGCTKPLPSLERGDRTLERHSEVPELSETAGSVPMTSGTERSKPNGEIKQFSSKHVRQGRRAEKAVWRTPAPFHFSVAVAELCDREG